MRLKKFLGFLIYWFGIGLVMIFAYMHYYIGNMVPIFVSLAVLAVMVSIHGLYLMSGPSFSHLHHYWRRDLELVTLFGLELYWNSIFT